MAELRAKLRALPRASQDLSRRLRVILDGTASCDAAIAANSRMTPDQRRKVIHRYLLVLGQVYALHRNFQINNSVETAVGDQLRAALDRLNDALADVSATLLGLVPAITVAPEPAPPVRVALGREDPPVDVPREFAARVTVSIANFGSQSIDHVKIGLDMNALPAGAHCSPDEPALIGEISPGQTARAEYQIHLKAPTDGLPVPCAGDISYFTAGAPAHLRPRTW